MKLYHGSNVSVGRPAIIPSNRALDFGCGFYLTSDYEQAAKWAKLTVLRRNSGEATVTVYDFSAADACLHTLCFSSADADWLRFVAANRTGKNVADSYDVITGPVANDNTMPVINLYLNGDYSEEEALKRLLPQKLKDQYVFKTEKALSFLSLCEVITV
ncbi:MAG: DUF3990 domain-containing protein [Ruminococcaceae bacterium]|nr:DUF3990 domain-containing protein [Oscillospiraceae bacterium]